MSEDPLTMRAKQAIAALAQSTSSEIKPEMVVHFRSDDRSTVAFNPSLGFAPEALQNEVLTILAAIGSIKDYVNAYCVAIGVPKSGDAVISASIEVALIHDLWNVDKHVKLSKPPRSGVKPKLRDIQKWMSVSATGPEEAAFFSHDMVSGTIHKEGKVEFLLDAMIVDDSENFIAWFRATCDRALEAWLAEMRRLGVDFHPELSRVFHREVSHL